MRQNRIRDGRCNPKLVFSHGRKHQGLGTVSFGMKERNQDQELPCSDFSVFWNEGTKPGSRASLQ